MTKRVSVQTGSQREPHVIDVAVSGLFQRTPKFTCEWSRRRLWLVSVDAVPALREKRMLVLRGGQKQDDFQSCPVSGKAVFVVRA